MNRPILYLWDADRDEWVPARDYKPPSNQQVDKNPDSVDEEPTPPQDAA